MNQPAVTAQTLPTLAPQTKLFHVVAILASLVFWMAPYPPMVDIPQHAGQVTLLLDLLRHQSPWQHEFALNLFTPYLVGYGLWALLAVFLPLLVSLKLLLTLSYLAYVYIGRHLRQHFQADDRLDWLLLPGFFGYAYKWGLLTYMISAPLGLLFIMAALSHAERCDAGRSSRRSAWLIFAAGIMLFFCHALTFLFCVGVGVILLLLRPKPLRARVLSLMPYLLLAPLMVLYWYIAQHNTISNSYVGDTVTGVLWQYRPRRLLEFVIYPWGDMQDRSWSIVIGSLALLSPWLLGSRLQPVRRAWVPFAALVLLWVTVPSMAMKTWLLYQRFAMFTLPFYSLLFCRPLTTTLAQEPTSTKARFLKHAGLVLPAICIYFLTMQYARYHFFAQESADYSRVTATMPDNQRVLELIFSPESPAANNLHVYAHFGLWYQAEHHGLTDMNYAWLPPQVVRFRAQALPAIAPGFELRPQSFDWVANRGDRYDYILVKSADGQVPATLMNNGHCPLQVSQHAGEWTLLKRLPCTPDTP